jgi:hypothetical protein
MSILKNKRLQEEAKKQAVKRLKPLAKRALIKAKPLVKRFLMRAKHEGIKRIRAKHPKFVSGVENFQKEF